MPIGFGVAASHAPGMYATTEEQWDAGWHRMSLDRGIPQPASVYAESGEYLEQMIRRIQEGQAELKRAYDAYNPEIVIIFGGDQNEMFDRSNVPQIMIYLGEHAKGPKPGGQYLGGSAASEPPPQVEFEVDVEFSKLLLNKLVKQEGFDVGFSYEMKNLPGRRVGLPHAFVNPPSKIMTDSDAKVCLIYTNTYDPPIMSAKRCYELGQAVARLVKNDPRRIAVMGSGGLSHWPGGKRSGWVDAPLDRWFLEQIATGNGRATKALYTFDSDTMVGGTGEIRSWICCAGAMEEMGSRATVVDYVVGGKSVTGLGMAYWPTEKVAAAAR